MKVRPSSRIAAFIAGVMVLLLALVWLMVIVGLTVEDGGLGLSLVWALVVLLALATLWGAWIALMEAFRRPCLLIDDDEVTISNRTVFSGPVQLPVDSILAVAVDRAGNPGLWDESDLPVEIEYDRGFMTWRAGKAERLAATMELTRLFVPLLDRDPELAPNLALVLNEPIDLSPYKRSTFSTGGFTKTVVGTKTTQGFLACVKDPNEAAAVFERLGLLRKLTSGDRGLLEPRTEDLKRVRRAERVAAVGFAYGALVIADLVWGLLRD